MHDHGTHTFHHALYIAPGDWRDNDTARQAAVFNAGMQVHAGELSTPLPQWRLDATHTQLTVLKPAEDGNGIVVRLVEQAGREETARLIAPPQFTHAQLTNLLEEPQQAISRTGDGFAIRMEPWKIVTMRLMR